MTIHHTPAIPTVAALTITLCAAFVAPPAAADAQSRTLSLEQVCNITPCVQDATGKLVGTANFPTMRKLAGEWVLLNAQRSGLIPDALYYYASTNCSGQKYMTENFLYIRTAHYDGSKFWTGPKIGSDFIWQSYSYPDTVARGGQCSSYGKNCYVNGVADYCHATGGPAEQIGPLLTFFPPFEIK